ncbi:CDP-alcohol phosphatidyltransferase family protein [Kineosporia succinea]|uniref:Phosphatidylglycerophosphate synthase n=1 Tax=Kineosporia succinea TaxID=84632 RepID=A0ABT9NYP9_9ACTN|nr:CDP-alcohol phosphatidyltransferase family protein [Kineosporia succinea]MDP9825551.1 phosphatidylglycerophosphate synthase [Kineosporia succinea]
MSTSGSSGQPLDIVFLELRPNVPSRVQALRTALAEQGVTIADEQVVTVSSLAGVATLAAAVAGQPTPGHPVYDDGTPPTGVGRNAVPRRPVALIPADLVINGTALGAVLDDPRVHSGALAGDESGGHRELLDVIRIDAADRPAAAGLVHELDPATPSSLLLDLAARLPGAGVTLRPVPIGGYVWARPADAAQAAAAELALAAVPERRVRLREAARGGDGFFSTFVLRKLSWRLTGPAERLGLTPNQVTAFSFVIGLVAAGLIATGDRPLAVVGALLLQLCVVVDCVDGELARYRRRFSRFGAWLDAGTDRIKEFAVVFALALAGARADQDLWPLAALAIGVQTFRSLADLSWSLRRAQLAGAVVEAPVSWRGPAGNLRTPSGFVSSTDTHGVGGWLKRIGHFPIGERFLLISLGAALWTPKGTLIALCAAGLAAAVYLLAALAARGRSLRGPQRPAVPADTGPWLGAALQRLRGRAAVIAAPTLAVVEMALVYLLGTGVGAEHGAAVMLVAVVAVAHYLQAYGVREGAATESWVVIGADLRMVAFLVLIVLPGVLMPIDTHDWVTGGLWALTSVVAVASVATSLKSWIGVAR